MKKSLLMALLTMGLFACSEKDVVDPTTGGGVSGELERSFLSVSIVPANASATRAGDDYRDGTTTENQVKSIRFYFFDKDGNAAPVKAGVASYYDVQPDEIDQNDNENLEAGPVESIISATIVIESPKGDTKPAYMAAVLNHNGDLPNVETIESLQEWVSNYSSHTEGTFTMSSSVYMGNKTKYDYAEYDEEGKPIGDDLVDTKQPEINAEIVAVPVYDHIKATRNEAIEKKATIYVERVLAKVSVNVSESMTGDQGETITLDDGTKLYEVGHVGSQAEEATPGDKIYVKFLGWNVTGVRRESRLVKQINTAWGENAFTNWNGLNWNDNSNKRSYWAVNPSNGTTDTPIEDNYEFFEFATETSGNSNVWQKDTKEKQAWSYDFELDTLPATVNKKYNYTYLQENAGAYLDATKEDKMNSKIIVAAQLVDDKGNALELVEWQGDIYRYGTDEQKEKVRSAMAADTYLYIWDSEITNDNGEKTGGWRKLTSDDVQLVFHNEKNADDAYEKTKDDVKRYYVNLEFKHDATNKEEIAEKYKNAKYAIYKYDSSSQSWVLDTNKQGNEEVGYEYDSEVVKNALSEENIGNIKHWNTGYTYYWVDIRHLATGEGTGYHGVVRNHWYDYTFTSVKGLGVPVSDPGQIIYPEVPKESEYFFLAAEVKILSWRMVKNENVGLGW